MSVEKLKQLHICSAGISRYKKKYEGQVPTISEVILDPEVPDIDVKLICSLSFTDEIKSMYNFINIQQKAADELPVGCWALLLAGQPHLAAFAPIEKFRGWHIVTVLSRQPDLADKFDINILSSQMLARLAQKQPALFAD